MKTYILYLILLTITISVPQCVAQPRSEYWRQRTSLFDILGLREGDIVFLGNSITDGGEFEELFEDTRIKNRGINSDDIKGIRERLKQITDYSPAKIFLLIGINDISHDDSIEKILAEYEILVSEIHSQSPTTLLYIQSVMPINNDFERYLSLKGKETKILTLNSKLEELAVKKGDTFINLWPFLADSEGKLKTEYTNDGLHLLGPGYLSWKEALLPYIKD